MSHHGCAASAEFRWQAAVLRAEHDSERVSEPRLPKACGLVRRRVGLLDALVDLLMWMAQMEPQVAAGTESEAYKASTVMLKQANGHFADHFPRRMVQLTRPRHMNATGSDG